MLHPLDVEIPVVGHGIGHFSGCKGYRQVAHRVFDRVCCGRKPSSRSILADEIWYERWSSVGVVTMLTSWPTTLPNHFGDLADAMVLVARVENLSVDLLGRPLEGFHIDVADIGDMNVGAQLIAAKNFDRAVVDGVIREDVDGQVEPQAGRIAADRGPAALRATQSLARACRAALLRRGLCILNNR